MSVFNPFCKSRKLIREGGAGYSEKGQYLTFDGNIAGKDAIRIGANLLYRISNKSIDLTKVEKATACVLDPESGAVNQIDLFSDEELPVTVRTIDGYTVLADDTVYVATNENGTYFWQEGDEKIAIGWISDVTCAETIHPIDPKYLPGVCLPVVELETRILSGDNTLSDTDCAKLDAVDAPVFSIKAEINVSGSENDHYVYTFAMTRNDISVDEMKVTAYYAFVFYDNRLLVFALSKIDGDVWHTMLQM